MCQRNNVEYRGRSVRVKWIANLRGSKGSFLRESLQILALYHCKIASHLHSPKNISKPSIKSQTTQKQPNHVNMLMHPKCISLSTVAFQKKRKKHLHAPIGSRYQSIPLVVVFYTIYSRYGLDFEQ